MNILIEFDRPAEPLNLNSLPTTRNSARTWRATKNLWKDATSWAALKTFGDLGMLGPAQRAMPPCHVYISIPVVGKRRRDAHNFTPTLKPVIDSLVDIGVWPDDNADWVSAHEPDLRPVSNEALSHEKVYLRLVPRGDDT